MLKTLTTFAAGAALATAGVTAATAQTYSIGSNPQGSLAYATAAAVAKVANEDAGLKARVVPQGGPIVTLPLVNNGELDFSIALSVVAGFAEQGRAMFNKKQQKDIKVAAALFPLILGLYVRKDSNIKRVQDVKGLSTGSKFTKQRIVGVTTNAMLATVGLSMKDMKGVPVPNGVRQVDDFMAGKIDVVSFSLSSGKTRQAHAAVGGIRVLSLPKTAEAEAAMQKVAPGSVIGTIQPGPRFPGVEEPTNVFTAPFLLMASPKTPDETVYQMVKTVHGAKEKLVASHKAFLGMDPKKIGLDIGLSYHPGAQKYFKEAGL